MKNGFKFFKKTQIIHFNKNKNSIYRPVLKIGGINLPYKDAVRFLGLDLIPNEQVAHILQDSELTVQEA